MIDTALTRIARAELLLPPEDDDDILPEDDGFFYPIDYLIKTWDAYRSYGVLPAAGGIDDQDPKWWQDINRLSSRFALIKRGLQEHKSGDDVIDELMNTSGGVHWKDMMHG